MVTLIPPETKTSTAITGRISATMFVVAVTLLSAVRGRWRQVRAQSERGAQTVDIAMWIGLLTIAAVVILWPQIQSLLSSLISKFKTP